VEPDLASASHNLAPWLVLAALPLLLATCTAFTKSSIVLAALRSGLGADNLIPLAALLAIAFVVTAVVMGPTALATFEAIDAAGGISTLLEGSAGAWLPAVSPLGDFLARHADADELSFFAGLQGLGEEHPLVLVPAFLVTELREALHMAVVLIVPFVAVDLVAAQVLALLGLVQQPVPAVTLPVKLLLFLAVGGWDVVIGGLVEGYL
jgi:type III secretory pathway component EscR